MESAINKSHTSRRRLNAWSTSYGIACRQRRSVDRERKVAVKKVEQAR